MEKIKVLVASRPRLMRELVVELITSQPDIEVMAEVQDDSGIAEIVTELAPDCVIIGVHASDNRPDICNSLFEQHPNLKTLAPASERNSCIFLLGDAQHSFQLSSCELFSGFLEWLQPGQLQDWARR